MNDFDDDGPFSGPMATPVARAPAPSQLGRPRLHLVILPLLALGLLTALAGIPSKESDPEENLADAERLVTETIALAQLMARNSGRQHGVVFAPEEDHFYIVDPTRGVAIHPDTENLAIVNLQDHDVDLVAAKFGASSTLVLEEDGRPRDGGRLEMTSHGPMLTLTLDPATGELEARR